MKLKIALINFNKKAMQEAKRRSLQEIARTGVNTIKREISKRRLINTGAMMHSVGADVTSNAVNFEIDADYAGIINDGVRRHKMKYLVDAGPIPIKVGRSKRVVYRVANSNNIKERGKWMHPGFKRGKGFFDVATEKIAGSCAKIIAEQGLI